MPPSQADSSHTRNSWLTSNATLNYTQHEQDHISCCYYGELTTTPIIINNIIHYYTAAAAAAAAAADENSVRKKLEYPHSAD
jgi:hypothetical protein